MVRIVSGALLVVLYLTGVTQGLTGVIGIAAGIVLMLTGLINFCPIYYALGWSTKNKKQE